VGWSCLRAIMINIKSTFHAFFFNISKIKTAQSL